MLRAGCAAGTTRHCEFVVFGVCDQDPFDTRDHAGRGLQRCTEPVGHVEENNEKKR